MVNKRLEFDREFRVKRENKFNFMVATYLEFTSLKNNVKKKKFSSKFG